MNDPATQLIGLELQWREAEDILRLAGAELATNKPRTHAAIVAIRSRISLAERMKQKLMQQIVALEESMECASPASLMDANS